MPDRTARIPCYLFVLLALPAWFNCAPGALAIGHAVVTIGHTVAIAACNGRLVPPQPGPFAAKEAKHLCNVLASAQSAGLSSDSLFVDVGASEGSGAKLASAYGHHVMSFECRMDAAQKLWKGPWWTPTGLMPSMPNTVKLISACVSEQAGLTVLARALDSSSMAELPWMQGTGKDVHWKARRDGGVNETKFDTVPVVRLDDALSARSLSTLKLPARVGFIKSDTNGNDLAVMRGAAKTLRHHKPVVFFERPRLPDGLSLLDKGAGTIECGLLDELGLRCLGYSCFCDTSDCLWVPANLSRMDAPRIMS